MDQETALSDKLRDRILSALHLGLLQPGDRLPSIRTLWREMGVDHRVVAQAYRVLEDEGLVEVRGRSGVYLAPQDQLGGEVLAETARWMAGVLVEGWKRRMTLAEIPELIRRCTSTVRLRCACVESNVDHLTWLCGEMAEDYGVSTVGLEVDALRDDDVLRAATRSADFLVTTTYHADEVRPIAERLRKPLVAVTLREDLLTEIRRRLAVGPVYFVGTDVRVEDKLRRMFDGAPAEYLRVLVVGRDDLASVPDGSPAYVLRSARDRLGGVPPNLRPLATLRAFSRTTQRAILQIIVGANIVSIEARL